MELLTIHGPVRDPYLSEFSERYDLDSGCSVESTLLPHLAVVLTADTRLRNKLVSVVEIRTPPPPLTKLTGTNLDKIGVRSGFRTPPSPQNSRIRIRGVGSEPPPPPFSPNYEQFQILFLTRDMASQDELKQVVVRLM